MEPIRSRVLSKLLVIILTLITRDVFAVSFDCAVVVNKIEKMICSNRELSELDNRLNNQFKNAKAAAKNPRVLIREQREWVAERNRCADVSCLSSSYSHRIAQLNVYVAKNVATCAISEKDLLGAWASSGVGDFEEMAFDVYEGKHAFMSWLHHHPEMLGTWSLDNCQLHIEDSSEPKLSFDYRIKRYTRRALYLQDDAGTVSAYKKAK